MKYLSWGAREREEEKIGLERGGEANHELRVHGQLLSDQAAEKGDAQGT